MIQTQMVATNVEPVIFEIILSHGGPTFIQIESRSPFFSWSEHGLQSRQEIFSSIQHCAPGCQESVELQFWTSDASFIPVVTLHQEGVYAYVSVKSDSCRCEVSEMRLVSVDETGMHYERVVLAESLHGEEVELEPEVLCCRRYIVTMEANNE